MSSSTESIPSHTAYNIGWICMRSVEYYAAQEMLDDAYKDADYLYGNDRTKYILGLVGKHHVVLNCPGSELHGSHEAAAIATRMKMSFPWIRIMFIVGIGGGASVLNHDIRLGDVVLGTKIGYYRFGQIDEDGPIESENKQVTSAITVLKGKIRGPLNLKQQIEVAADNSAAGPHMYKRPAHDSLYQSDFIHKDNFCTCNDANLSTQYVERRKFRNERDVVKLHDGAILSIYPAVTSALQRDKIALKGDCLCFDTESAGLCNEHQVLPIRGISNYSDGHGDESWEEYASFAAAVCAKELLGIISPNEILKYPLHVSNTVAETRVECIVEEIQSLLNQPSKKNPVVFGRLENFTMEAFGLIGELIRIDVARLRASSPETIAQLGGIQENLVKLQNLQSQLEESHSKLKERIREISVLSYVIDREEWEQLKEKVNDNAERISSLSQITAGTLSTTSKLVKDIGDVTGDEKLGVVSRIIEHASTYSTILGDLKINMSRGRGTTKVSKGANRSKDAQSSVVAAASTDANPVVEKKKSASLIGRFIKSSPSSQSSTRTSPYNEEISTPTASHTSTHLKRPGDRSQNHRNASADEYFQRSSPSTISWERESMEKARRLMPVGSRSSHVSDDPDSSTTLTSFYPHSSATLASAKPPMADTLSATNFEDESSKASFQDKLKGWKERVDTSHHI